MYPLNTSELIGSLQSQIIGLQLQPLPQSTLNSIKMFDSTNKAEFATWAQGAPLKSANYLEDKETNSGKKLSWTTLKQHLTSNYFEIPYDTHTVNAYDTLQQGTGESTKAYLHRAQYILECIHHTNDVSSAMAIGTNHAKILTGLKDGKLHNKLAESKAKKWTNMAQALQDITEIAVNFKRSRGYSLPCFEVNHTSD